ncbi:ABC transporter substrate-binding protein [Paracidovorax valerianellae]|uniref:Peptide/nickel transport system substrate-binding protein n=1 Tax=Paracidovorax valerianellae TaxID=187868 RepID=A0A1G6XYN6_9BURK|nr:ABC transporter substrate-binding protein [Paracidovorax valerianellae]MDA8443595.1 ABC transporter substrate-binding protein [Paracidovorax valerianellae]SDD83131.1 peptide/nickel transport system substrate-binding protein [Paracidovorax valerianellae]
MRFSLSLAATLAAAVFTVGTPLAAQSATFRFARSADVSSWDIHAQNVGVNNALHSAVYETLVEYNSKTFKPEPQLATAWKLVGPTQLRITLRQGVKFSDGSALTADDVKFSLERAKAKTSNYAVYTQGIDRVEVVDAHTVDIFSEVPNPVLVNQLTELRIMSKPWAEKNNATAPKDIKTSDEPYTHRNTLGTGPFVLKSWAPDQRLVLAANPHWWGKGKFGGNVTDVVYTPIKSDATRTAALLSGEVDFVLDPSLQDVPRIRQTAGLKVLDGAENRTIFLGLDQFRDELQNSSVKGKNPLKDVRVRKALYQAIDINAIQRVVLRGLAQPTGAIIARQVNGWTPKADVRWPYDPAAAQKLLAEAGYPQGFDVDFACSAGRYINDEQLCQAITAQWSKVGVRAKLRTLPFAAYFPMIQRNEASIYLLGWGVPTFDAFYSLQSLIRSPGAGGDGNFNLGRFSDPQQDALIERIKKETDAATRNTLIEQALVQDHQLISHIPLYNQVIPWAASQKVEIVHRADNRIDWRLLKVN